MVDELAAVNIGLYTLSMNLGEISATLNPSNTQFDGDGHTFTFRDSQSYERAQGLAKEWMSLPKSERPRGWSRGKNEKGELFVRIRLH